MSKEMSYTQALNEFSRMANKLKAFEKIGEVIEMAARAERDVSVFRKQIDDLKAEVEGLEARKAEAERYIAKHGTVLAELRANEDALRRELEQERQEKTAAHNRRIAALRDEEKAAREAAEEARATLRELNARLAEVGQGAAA